MTDKTMLDILSKFADASDESKPLTEGKKASSSDAEMANILGKLQQLNEGAEVVAEAHGKVGEKCSCCGNTIKKDGTCGCDEDCPHCGGKPAKVKEEEMDEASCSSKRGKSAMKEAIEQIEDKLLKEYAEFKEAKQELDEEPNEGNEFSGALAQAKKDGKEEFEVDGKKYKVTAEGFEKWEPVGTKKKTKHGTLEKTKDGVKHTRDYKPDYLDLDGDGDKEEPMKKAAKDKKEKK